MTLHINGEQRDFPDGLTVAALVAQLGMKPDRVAVELNLEIVPRTQWDTTALNTGDKLEIVHFVGGGSTGLPKPSPQHVFITSELLIPSPPLPLFLRLSKLFLALVQHIFC